jgi:hypothetical protein
MGRFRKNLLPRALARSASSASASAKTDTLRSRKSDVTATNANAETFSELPSGFTLETSTAERRSRGEYASLVSEIMARQNRVYASCVTAGRRAFRLTVLESLYFW